MTAQEKRLEKLGTITKELEKMAAALEKQKPLSLKQEIGMVLSITEVRNALNRVQSWSTR